MKRLSTSVSLVRKVFLIVWAVAVFWIYLGNLVNFHLYKIWGKQLIPVACSSTRSKEKDSIAFAKNSVFSKSLDKVFHSDFLNTYRDISVATSTLSLCISFHSPQNSSYSLGLASWSLRGPPCV